MVIISWFSQAVPAFDRTRSLPTKASNREKSKTMALMLIFSAGSPFCWLKWLNGHWSSVGEEAFVEKQYDNKIRSVWTHCSVTNLDQLHERVLIAMPLFKSTLFIVAIYSIINSYLHSILFLSLSLKVACLQTITRLWLRAGYLKVDYENDLAT